MYNYTLHCGRRHVVIVYKLLEKQIYWEVILKIALELMVNKGLRCLQRVNMLNSKIMREK